MCRNQDGNYYLHRSRSNKKFQTPQSGLSHLTVPKFDDFLAFPARKQCSNIGHVKSKRKFPNRHLPLLVQRHWQGNIPPKAGPKIRGLRKRVVNSQVRHLVTSLGLTLVGSIITGFQEGKS